MADPRGFFTLPSGVKVDASALDEVPVDWADVEYRVVIAGHPDDPTGTPILKYRAVGLAPTEEPLRAETEPSGGVGSVRDSDGNLIYAEPE